MTDKMRTAIATFTYFITEILKCTELNKTDEDIKNLNAIRTVRCGFHYVTVIKQPTTPTGSVHQTHAAVVEERLGLFLLLAITRQDKSG